MGSGYNTFRFLSRLFPNLLVLSGSTALAYFSLVLIIPYNIKSDVYPKLSMVSWLVTFFFFVMFTWCWLYTAVADPGRIEDDLKRRGIYYQVKRGEIPYCLRQLPICSKCGMPKPYTSSHCNICGSCILRVDHHCGVTGVCIADKNFKSFILSFFYACIFGVTLSLPSALCFFCAKDFNIISLILMIYGFVLGLMLGIFGISFLFGGVDGSAVTRQISFQAMKIKISKIWKTFGDKWYEKLIPIQKESTNLAWPGVTWDLTVDLL